MSESAEALVENFNEEKLNRARDELFTNYTKQTWDEVGTPTDRLKKYIEIEISLAKSEIRKALPGFNDKADQNLLRFSNALNCIETKGKDGRDSVAKVIEDALKQQLDYLKKHSPNKHTPHLLEIDLYSAQTAADDLKTQFFQETPSTPPQNLAA